MNKGVEGIAQAMGIPEHAEKLRDKIKKFECQTGTVVTEENSFEIDMIFVVYGKLTLKRVSWV